MKKGKSTRDYLDKAATFTRSGRERFTLMKWHNWL